MVPFDLGGSATWPQDYSVSGAVVNPWGGAYAIIPAGQDHVDVTITSVDDSIVEDDLETVTLTIISEPIYIIGTGSATIQIKDNDTLCTPAQSGLMSWWRGEGDAQDGGGSGNNGVVHGGVTFLPGEVGQSFHFNGANSYVQVPDSPSIRPSGSFTIEGWINYEGLTSTIGGTIVMKGPDSEVPADWALTVSGNHKLRPHVNVNNQWYYFDGNITLNPNTWYHVALVYDGTALRGYVNGIEDVNHPVSGSVRTSSNPLKIGTYASGYPPTSTSFFKGQIDELTFYNRALSPADLQNIYTAGTAGKCPPPPPVVQFQTD